MVAQILIRSPDDLKQTLRQAAKSRGFTLNALLLQILRDWVKKNPPADQTDAS